MSKRLFILDANALLHRAWHALPPLTAPDGTVVNAVYGVLMAVLQVVARDRPDAFVACWDTAAPTFRHEAFEAYKAQRERQADELYAQIPLLQEGLGLLGVPSLECLGFEADDLIGTLAKQAAAQGWEVMIFTGDRDLLQLITPGISVSLFKKGMTELQLVDEATMPALFGLTPVQMVDYKILRGDPSDNIPGVKGIGEKGAKELLAAFGSVEKAMAAAHDPRTKLPPRQRAHLLAGEPELPKWRALVTIHTDAPLAWRLEATPLDPAAEPFVAFLRRFGFRSLVPGAERGSKAKLAKGKKQEPSATAVGDRGASAAVPPADVSIPPVQTCTSCADLEAWFARSPGQLALVVGAAGGDMLAPDVWLGSVTETLRLTDGLWEEQGFQKTVNACFAVRAKEVVMHGTKEAMHALARRGIVMPEVGFDTQVAAYLVDAQAAEPTLAELAERYLGFPPPVPSASAPAVLLALQAKLAAALTAKKMDELFERFERPLIPVLFGMEEAGIQIDLPYLAGLAHEFQAEQARLEREMREAAGHAFNPGSPAQLAKVLFSELKLPTDGVKKGKTGYSTASSELEKLRGHHPIIELIENYREVAKLLSTYIQPLPTLADARGRVHTTFHQTIASTGRLSSTDPNLQNIPIRTEYGRRIRKAFIAPPGRLLLSCDYAQIELRIAAALAKDKALLKAFADGQDIHKTTAAAMWGVPLAEVTADQRRAAKTVNFGVLYGQGAFGLAAGSGVSLAEAREFIDRYFTAYKDLRGYLEATKAFARAHGYVETVFGRRRPIPELLSPNAAIRARAERMAINMPIQGAEADVLKLAMIALAERLPQWSGTARLLLQVHDELVFEVDAAEALVLAPKICQTMQNVADLGVPLTVEAKAGQNWGELGPVAEARPV